MSTPSLISNAEACARVYYQEMIKHASLEKSHGEWSRALSQLWGHLTPEEYARLLE
jgi:hypothetical protein